jgi:hypothetical protein
MIDVTNIDYAALGPAGGHELVLTFYYDGRYRFYAPRNIDVFFFITLDRVIVNGDKSRVMQIC